MKKFKIVIADYYYANQDQENAAYAQLGEDVEIVDCTKIVPGGIKDPEQLQSYVADADALVVQFARVTKELIDSMRKCKVIARYAIGVDTIDIDAATAKGIYVSNVPDYCIYEVANTAIAHIMNAVRKISVARDMLLDGSFNMNAIKPIRRMEEMTLCLLGFGNIARNVYEKMKPFFKEIFVYDPFVENDPRYAQVSFRSLDEALSKADVLSIHVPLNKHTEHMISESQFSQMKDGVIIVNTARGKIIDEEALIKAVRNGKIGYAGLDVLSTEEFMDSPLLKEKNVALTPHVSWYSEEAGLDLQKKTAENVVQTLLNGKPKYAVNRF